jgi:hypothetical protein
MWNRKRRVLSLDGRSTTRAWFIQRWWQAVASTLTLLMSRIVAHHKHHATPANDFTVLANSFDAGAHFHGLP